MDNYQENCVTVITDSMIPSKIDEGPRDGVKIYMFVILPKDVLPMLPASYVKRKTKNIAVKIENSYFSSSMT